MADKTVRKTIRFSELEYKQILYQADELGLTFSDFCRQVLLKKKLRVSKKINTSLLYEINKIGNNLNQIAKHCNLKKSLDEQVARELKSIKNSMENLANDL